MTEVITQQTLGPASASSRQDVLSALLNDYGNSFGHDDVSPSAYSPAPVSKQLPSRPVPQAESMRNKPLPAVQRMSMKFPLRDDDTPSSPEGRDQRVPQRKRIASRSLSRDGKPPSLTLTVSNGSTATIPPTPALPAPQHTLSSSGPTQDRNAPPPPPAKSLRRKSERQLGNPASRGTKELGRNDSLLSQGESIASVDAPFEATKVTPVVQRKALQDPASKKFKSLAELGQGPRGGKGGPLLPISAPRKSSVDSQGSEASQPRSSRTTNEDTQAADSAKAGATNRLPPTPDEDRDSAVPAPPRKVFAGLPSNPRTRGPASPLHIRGKSSTGFNILKAHRPAPPIPTMSTITPEMTPSPTLKPNQIQRDTTISPVSPLPPPKDQHRPFSYQTAASPQPKTAGSSNRPATTTTARASPATTTQPPRTRTTTLDPPNPSPSIRPSSAPFPPQNPTRSPAPPPTLQRPISPPPFTPLTRHPIALPLTLIPRITPAQLDCYTSHRTAIWSNNVFQSMGCMVCHANERDRKWACTWCQLRVCRACCDELSAVPGRRVRVLLERRGNVDMLLAGDENARGTVVAAGRAQGDGDGEGVQHVEADASHDDDVDAEYRAEPGLPAHDPDASRGRSVRREHVPERPAQRREESDEYDPFRG